MSINATPLRTTAIVLGLLISAGGAIAQGASQQGGAQSRADRKFVEDAAMSGAAEVQLSQIAQKNATSAQVKQFADHMVQDHEKANSELQQIASAKGMQVPADAGSMHEKMAEKLSKVTGPDFDKQYMSGMLADHKKVVALFQKEAKSGTDPELKAYADKTLPTLQGHLQMAQSMQGASGGEKAVGFPDMPLTGSKATGMTK